MSEASCQDPRWSSFEVPPALALEQFPFMSRELLPALKRRDSLREVAETVTQQVGSHTGPIDVSGSRRSGNE